MLTAMIIVFAGVRVEIHGQRRINPRRVNDAPTGAFSSPVVPAGPLCVPAGDTLLVADPFANRDRSRWRHKSQRIAITRQALEPMRRALASRVVPAATFTSPQPLTGGSDMQMVNKV